MHFNNLSIIGKLTLAYLAINACVFFSIYFFDWPILQRWYVNLVVTLFSLSIVGYLFNEQTQDYTPSNAYLLLSVTIAFCFLSSTLTSLFLHYYLDPGYKYMLADQVLEKHMKKLHEIEREQNVIFDADEDTERETVLRQYSVKQIWLNYLMSVPLAFLFAWLIQSVIVSDDNQIDTWR